MSEPSKVWIEQCDATSNIREHFGVHQALRYLVGEKFMNFLDAAKEDEAFMGEIPAFATKIRSIFEPSQLAAYLESSEENGRGGEQSIRPCAAEETQAIMLREWLIQE